MSKVTIQVENELKDIKPTYVTDNILECVKFWNKNSELAIENNLSGKWGDKETQKMATEMKPDDFLLEMLLRDCRVFVNSEFAKNSGDKYECGRTRSHIWIHINDKRVFMIHA